MSNPSEKLEIRQFHSAEKWLVTRTIREELNKEEIIKIHAEIKKGLEGVQAQLKDVPKQAEDKLASLRKDEKTLKERLNEFFKAGKKYIQEAEAAEEKTENININP